MKFCQEYDEIRKVFLSSLPADAGMKHLCRRWNCIFGGNEWILAQGINFHCDVGKIEQWLNEIIAEEEIPPDIEALYFSVSQREKNDSYDLRLTGSSCFVLDSDGFFEDILLTDSFIPKKCLSHSQALEDLFCITNGNIDSPAGRLLPLAFTALAASSVCSRSQQITVLLKSGDIILAASHVSRFPLLIKHLRCKLF